VCGVSQPTSLAGAETSQSELRFLQGSKSIGSDVSIGALGWKVSLWGTKWNSSLLINLGDTGGNPFISNRMSILEEESISLDILENIIRDRVYARVGVERRGPTRRMLLDIEEVKVV
jgi:hypothetical protein